MTNQDQNVETTSASVAPKPKVIPRLVLLFVALVTGAIVIFSFGHAVNVCGYHMGQSAIKLKENQEQFEKIDGGKFSQASRREEPLYSLTDNLEDEASKMIESSKPEFHYRFTFTDKELTKSHFYTESLLPTGDGKCERILLDGNPISPVENTSSTDPAEGIAASRENRESVVKCSYPTNFDDYFTWKIIKPEGQRDRASR